MERGNASTLALTNTLKECFQSDTRFHLIDRYLAMGQKEKAAELLEEIERSLMTTEPADNTVDYSSSSSSSVSGSEDQEPPPLLGQVNPARQKLVGVDVGEI
jgi:hypothetical protein